MVAYWYYLLISCTIGPCMLLAAYLIFGRCFLEVCLCKHVPHVWWMNAKSLIHINNAQQATNPSIAIPTNLNPSLQLNPLVPW